MSGAPIDEAMRLVRAVRRLSAIVHPGPDSGLFNARLLGAISGGITLVVDSAEPFFLKSAAITLEDTADRMKAEADAARAKRQAIPA